MKPTALTRAVSPKLAGCELTHLERQPIDIDKAIKQHHNYEKALKRLGYSVKRIPPAPELPDGVFVEDTAVVFPEMAIITRPGAPSRRPETDSMAAVLKEYRELRFITSPGTVDGGDVFTLGKRVYIGLSTRTNEEGIKQFKKHLEPFGYKTDAIKVTGCLHLKTAVAHVEDNLLYINPNWLSPEHFDGYHCEPVHPSEPYGANIIQKNNIALCPAAFPHSIEWLDSKGYNVIFLDQSEMAKAEAGLTCSSVLID